MGGGGAGRDARWGSSHGGAGAGQGCRVDACGRFWWGSCWWALYLGCARSMCWWLVGLGEGLHTVKGWHCAICFPIRRHSLLSLPASSWSWQDEAISIVAKSRPGESTGSSIDFATDTSHDLSSFNLATGPLAASDMRDMYPAPGLAPVLSLFPSRVAGAGVSTCTPPRQG